MSRTDIMPCMEKKSTGHSTMLKTRHKKDIPLIFYDK